MVKNPFNFDLHLKTIYFLVRGGHKTTIGLANGSFASCSMSELDEIKQALNIILPNPFAMLTQETMKTFLHNKKPSEMFKLVEHGTGIKFIKQGIASLKDKLASLGHKEQSMVQVSARQEKIVYIVYLMNIFVQLLSNMEAELKSWKAKEKQLKQADEAQTLLQQLELESVWVDVHELEKELGELQNDLEEATKAKDGVLGNIGKWKEKQAQLREQMRFSIDLNFVPQPYYLFSFSIQAEDGTNARNLYNAKKLEKDELQNKHGDTQKEIDKFINQLRAINRQLKTNAEERKVLQEEIGKIANQ
jgi:DNA repair exonuclease SbcCD ATPase subunit